MAVKLNHGKALSMLSLTSLIDVVFLLLIFFLVATRFAEEDRLKQMDVELPSASEARPLTQRTEALAITVTERGAVFVGDKQLNLADLDRYLRSTAVNNPLNTEASVKGDRRADWEAICNVLNLCQKYGIKATPQMDGRTSGSR